MALWFRQTFASHLIRLVALVALLAPVGAPAVEAATFPIVAPGVIVVQGSIELGDCERWPGRPGRVHFAVDRAACAQPSARWRAPSSDLG